MAAALLSSLGLAMIFLDFLGTGLQEKFFIENIVTVE